MPARRRPPSVSFYYTVFHKIGEVHDGAATMDWMVQEQERGITITSAATTCFWRFPTVQGKDTCLIPSSIRLTSSTPLGTWTLPSKVRASHCAFWTVPWLSMCALLGVFSPRRKPCGVRQRSTTFLVLHFVNKMDRTGADFFQRSSPDRRKIKGTPQSRLQVPIGAETEFQGVVDLLDERRPSFGDDATQGMTYKVVDIPCRLG